MKPPNDTIKLRILRECDPQTSLNRARVLVGCVRAAAARMSATILQLFEGYQRSRVQFVQAVAEAANRPENVRTLYSGGALQLLRPLLLDTVRWVAAAPGGRRACCCRDWPPSGGRRRQLTS